MSDFTRLFVQRSTSRLLQVIPPDATLQSRIGGRPPAIFDAEPWRTAVAGYQYLLTLSDGFSTFLGGQDVSVFLPARYEAYRTQSRYPDLPLHCLVHPPSAGRSSNEQLIYPALQEGSLAELPKGAEAETDEEVAYFLKIGGTPYLLQDEPSYYEPVAAAGSEFVFQLDENGLPADFLAGSYPFGFGAVYFYGKLAPATAQLTDLVAGFWQK